MQSNRTNISAQVVTDSTHCGSRLTTFEVTFPRFILAEFNTHRVLSRNSASSRAIPVWKRLVDTLQYPFVPLAFGKNRAGMQSSEEISEGDTEASRNNWLVGRDVAVLQAFYLAGGQQQIMKDSKDNPQALLLCEQIIELAKSYPDITGKMRRLSVGVHKQHANRVLEPYAWHTVIVTGTQWRNFYAPRASSMAQPEIQTLAILMAEAHLESSPQELIHTEWHLPYITEEDKQEMSDPLALARISSGRCSRVSYLTHDGKRSLQADLTQADSLQKHGHTSPFEHPAMACMSHRGFLLGGNYNEYWVQYRKRLTDESDFSKLISDESLLDGMKGNQKLVDFVHSLPG